MAVSSSRQDVMYTTVQGRGPDLILVHGWGFNQAIWQKWLPFLIPYFRVHLIDLPGFGRSAWYPHAYQKESLMKNLAASLPTRAHWLGWSFGGLMALQFAACYPERVMSLSLLASTPKFLASVAWSGIDAHVFATFKKQLAENSSRALRQFFAAQCLQQPTRHWLPVIAALQQQGEPHPHALAMTLQLLQAQDLRDALVTLKCPVLHILGYLDPLIPNQLSNWLYKAVPHHAVEMLLHAAHIPFLSAPKICAQYLKQHIL